MGDIKEDPTGSSPGINNKDEYKDQYNNELGRRVGGWLKDWLAQEASEGRTYTDAEKEAMLDDLVKDTDDSGDMIKNENTDNKTKNFVETDPAYQNPKGDVTWDAPSNDWQGSSAERDYSKSDDFNENPIGFVLDLPAHLADAAGALANKLFDSLDDLLDALGGAIVPAVIDALIPGWLQNLLGSWGDAQATASPLILDWTQTGLILRQ